MRLNNFSETYFIAKPWFIYKNISRAIRSVLLVNMISVDHRKVNLNDGVLTLVNIFSEIVFSAGI